MVFPWFGHNLRVSTCIHEHNHRVTTTRTSDNEMIRRKKISSLQKNSNHDFFDNRNGNVNDNYGDLWLTEGRKGKKGNKCKKSFLIRTAISLTKNQTYRSKEVGKESICSKAVKGK